MEYPATTTTVSVDLNGETVQRLVMLGMLEERAGLIVTTPRGDAWMRKLFIRATRPV